MKSLDELIDDIVDFENLYGSPFNLSTLLQNEEQIILAAEFKRSSPSKGDININADILQQCTSYVAGGARILSILTEPMYFKGIVLFSQL